MSAGEIAWRARDIAMHAAWSRFQVRPGSALGPVPSRTGPGITSLLPHGTGERVPESAKRNLIRSADTILDGRFRILGIDRTDMRDPDWFRDPITGKWAPDAEYAFKIDHRRESVTGNVKQVWEISRLHHLTLLSAAWYLTGDEKYARAVDSQLRSWWSANPFLSGINWTSGIEIGIRLISFTWIRRLLDEWPGTPALFEDNDLAVSQIYWHQRYLSTFASHGSSANNHAVAELAGLLVSSSAFRWFKESRRWRDESKVAFERQITRNTFRSGLNREQASEYHEFVTDLALVAATEAEACGEPLHPKIVEVIGLMLDAEAATVDSAGRAPRQGDGDDGRALVLDGPEMQRSSILLAAGAALVGAAPWWPDAVHGVTSTLLGSLFPPDAQIAGPRSEVRPSHFIDAGFTLLSAEKGGPTEIWCRCDGGPHGYLSIAGHAHADALSVEVRYGGIDVLADPGTFCYHGEPEHRRYFRSTLGHNTIEIAGTDQSLAGGPFMWLRHARTRGVEIEWKEPGSPRTWSAEHDGYETLDPPATHRRTVSLDIPERLIEIDDVVTTAGSHPLRIAFHLGPRVDCRLDGNVAHLEWDQTEDGQTGSASLELPTSCAWSAHNGESDPMLGWFSSSFGAIEPTTVLVGKRNCEPGRTVLHTALKFAPRDVVTTAVGREKTREVPA
jgi:hypothetical protein